MSKLAIAVLGCVVAVSAIAQDEAIKMTREELLSFLPGTKVTHVTVAGSERHWTNGPDGKFFATSNNKKYGSALGTQMASNEGAWTVSDEGKYCIDIDWKRVHEKWCAYVLKGQGDIYYLNAVDDKHKIVFAKD
jgi:hypothetical protein